MNIQSPLPGDLLTRDADAFFHQSGSSPCLAVVKHAQGCWLELEDGRRLIDLHGNTAHHLGHAHPEIIAALKAQLDELVFSPRRYTNEPATLLAEALTALWPSSPAKALFATGGSDAMEIALKLARVNTKRYETISLEDSYHGHGFGAFGLSSSKTDPRLGPFLGGRHHVTPYWREDLGGPGRMLAEMRNAFESSKTGISAVVAEAIRSNCHVPPDGLWQTVRTLCDEFGALLIFDEIPSGLGKTGRFFAFEHFGVVPDIAVLGKSLGGGALPISAVIADAKLDSAPELSLGHYTHEKNPLSTRAALTMVNIVQRDRLAAGAESLGQYAKGKFADLARIEPAILGARGLGLLLAVELDAAAFPEALRDNPASAVVAGCLKDCVSTVTKGRSAVSFSPPLTVTEQEIDRAAECVARAVGEIRAG
jgi:4-aminobutyrate aminotransferase